MFILVIPTSLRCSVFIQCPLFGTQVIVTRWRYNSAEPLSRPRRRTQVVYEQGSASLITLSLFQPTLERLPLSMLTRQ